MDENFGALLRKTKLIPEVKKPLFLALFRLLPNNHQKQFQKILQTDSNQKLQIIQNTTKKTSDQNLKFLKKMMPEIKKFEEKMMNREEEVEKKDAENILNQL